MKKYILTLIMSAFCLGLMAQTMPDVKVELSNGTTVSAKSLCGKRPLIVSYWSIACKPCIQELNAINDSLEDWKDKADFDVVAVSVDDVRLKATAKAKTKSLGWDFTCVFDANQDLMRAMNVPMTPHTFIVDKKGNIVYSHSGYTPGSEEELFEKLLELCK